MTPVLMVAAVFGSASARAQETAPLPEAPAPASSDMRLPQALDVGTNNPQPSPFAIVRPAPLDLSQPKFRYKTYDFTVKPEIPANGGLTLPGNMSRVALFANRHIVNGEEGFDLAAEIRLKSRFSIIAGTTDTRYRINDGRWKDNGMSLKPEITIPGAWNTETSSMTLRPKGRGFMIGFKMQIP